MTAYFRILFSVFAQIEVPEVWRYDGQSLWLGQVNRDEYPRIEASIGLGGFPVADVATGDGSELKFYAAVDNLGWLNDAATDGKDPTPRPYASDLGHGCLQKFAHQGFTLPREADKRSCVTQQEHQIIFRFPKIYNG